MFEAYQDAEDTLRGYVDSGALDLIFIGIMLTTLIARPGFKLDRPGVFVKIFAQPGTPVALIMIAATRFVLR